MAGKQLGVTLKFIDDFSADFNKTLKSINNGTKQINACAKQIENVGKSISNAGKAMTAAVTLPIVALGTKAVDSAGKFETSIAKIMTLEDKLGQYGDDVATIQNNAINTINKLSNEFAKDANDVADAYYNIASAFNETNEMEEGMTVALRLASAGQTDATSSAKALAQVYNAYGGSLEHIGNVLAKTQNWGFTTIAELGDSMATVLPSAKQMGVDLEDVYAAMAVITSTGVETSEAVTYLKNAFVQATKAGDMSKLQNGGLLSYLEEVNKEADGFDKVLAKFKNIRAVSGIAGMTGQLELFNKYRDEIKNSDGALDLMQAIMEATFDFQKAKFLIQLSNLLRKIGEQILPTITNWLEKMNSKLSNIDFSKINIDAIIKGAVALASIGPILMLIGGGITKVAGIIKSISFLKSAIALKGGLVALAGPLGIVAAVAAGIAFIGFAIYKNFDKIKPAIDKMLVSIKPFLEILKTIGVFCKTYILSVLNNIISVIGKIIVDAINALTNILTGVGQILKGIFTLNFGLIGEGIKNIFVGVVDFIANILKTPFRIMASIVNGIISAINSISIKTPEWLPLIGGKTIGFDLPTIPEFANGVENFSGGLARINEKGGEIVDLPNGSRVIPHDISSNIAKQKSDIKIAIAKLADSIVVREEADIDRITTMLANKLVKAYANS